MIAVFEKGRKSGEVIARKEGKVCFPKGFAPEVGDWYEVRLEDKGKFGLLFPVRAITRMADVRANTRILIDWLSENVDEKFGQCSADFPPTFSLPPEFISKGKGGYLSSFTPTGKSWLSAENFPAWFRAITSGEAKLSWRIKKSLDERFLEVDR